MTCESCEALDGKLRELAELARPFIACLDDERQGSAPCGWCSGCRLWKFLDNHWLLERGSWS